MDGVVGARTFHSGETAYDRFMGRYSRPLGPVFADFAEVAAGQHVLDIGCGPGALTEELVTRVGADAVAAVDPTPAFVTACAARLPGVDVQEGRAESLPFADAQFDRALSQLVLHFVTDATSAASEMRRVLRPGGIAAATVWDLGERMQMLRHFWDAALTVRPDAPDEARVLRFGRPGEISALFSTAELDDVVELELMVASRYDGFEELWAGFREGVGPAGEYLLSLAADEQRAVRDELFLRVGRPEGAFTLTAVARAVRGRRPEDR